MFSLTIDHLIETNLAALERGTLQAQNPREYDRDEAHLLGYYLTPDGKYTCCIGCALPEQVLLPLKGLALEMKDMLGILFRTDVPYAQLWHLQELHDAWLNRKLVNETPQKLRDILMGALGLTHAARINERVYRKFLEHLRATTQAIPDQSGNLKTKAQCATIMEDADMLDEDCIRAVELIDQAVCHCEEESISEDDIAAALLSEAVTKTVEADGCYKAAEKLFGISRMVLKWANEQQH